MSISFGSIGTGLPSNIVDQIIAAERIPIQKMEVRKEKLEDKKALLGELERLVRDLQGDAMGNKADRDFRELKVSANGEIVDVKVDKNVAQPGNYQFEVTAMAQKSSAFSSGVADPDETYVGVGFIQYFLPNGDSRDIYIDSSNASLRGIAKKINQDSENGMRATVVNDGTGSDTPWRLIISLDETGDEKRADFPYLYFVDGEVDLYLDKERPAQDAKIKLDGFEIELPGNKTDALIPGATIELLKAQEGTEFTIAIAEDVEAIAEKIDGTIQKINAVLKFIKDQNKLDENSDTARTLGGDLTLQQIESRISTAVFSSVETSSGVMRMNDVGIAFQRDGLLSFDKDVFQKKLAGDYKAVSQLITGEFSTKGEKLGFMDNIYNLTQMALQAPSGPITSRKAGVQSNIDNIDRQIENQERLIARKQDVLKTKFSRLEETMARIKTQGAGLAGLGVQNFNPVQQLGSATG